MKNKKFSNFSYISLPWSICAFKYSCLTAHVSIFKYFWIVFSLWVFSCIQWNIQLLFFSSIHLPLYLSTMSLSGLHVFSSCSSDSLISVVHIWIGLKDGNSACGRTSYKVNPPSLSSCPVSGDPQQAVGSLNCELCWNFG